MNCPKCNRENDPEAGICPACGIELPQALDTPGKIEIRVSKLAIASVIFAVLSLPCFLIYGDGEMRKIIRPAPLYAIIFLISAFLAVFLGIAALVIIEMKRGRISGQGYAATGIAIPLTALVVTITFVTLARPRSIAYKLYCGTNLSGIGKAMLIYSNDYDDEFPRAGGPNSKWGPTPNWKAKTPAEAYDLKDGDGQASMSANFFLLVKFAEVAPKSFICRDSTNKGRDKGDKGTTEFTLAEYDIHTKDLVDLYDFGPDPSKHCSYTYHFPYGEYSLTSSSDPGMAVTADRNPWLDTPGRKARSAKDWARFDPNGSRDAIKFGNATTHQNDGQNVLFIDGHTSFEKQPNCGVNDDNIYTSHEGEDIIKGIRPTPTSKPTNKTDSLLLHDPPRGTNK